MRKKYLSALLFGALLFASAGTFTSCKDYDDDINNLQTQIDKVASDLESLKTTVDNLGGVTDVKIESGKLLVTAGGQTVSYDLPAAAEVEQTTVELDGQDLKVNGEVIGQVGDKVTVNEDGYLCVNGTATAIKAGKYAILENEANGVYTITLPDTNGELKTIELAKASANITIEIADDKYFFTNYAATAVADEASGGINWGVSDNDQKNWAGPKGAVTEGQVLVGQISSVKVNVLPVSYDLGAQDLKLVDSEGNDAPAIVSAVATKVEGPIESGSRAANSRGEWFLNISLSDELTENNIGNAFANKDNTKNLKYALSVNGSLVTGYDFVIDTQKDETVTPYEIVWTDLYFGEKQVTTNSATVELGETEFFVKNAKVYDYYIAIAEYDINDAEKIGVEVVNNKIVASNAAAGETIDFVVRVLDINGNVVNPNNVDTPLSVTFGKVEAGTDELATTSYKAMPIADGKNLEIKVNLEDVFSGLTADEATSIDNISWSVENDNFLLAKGNVADTYFTYLDSKGNKIGTNGTENEVLDNVTNIKKVQYAKLSILKANINDAVKPGKYSMIMKLTNSVTGDIKNVNVPVEITLPTFDELFSKVSSTDVWANGESTLRLQDGMKLDYTIAFNKANGSAFDANFSIKFDNVNNKDVFKEITDGVVTLESGNIIKDNKLISNKLGTEVTYKINGKAGLAVKSDKFTTNVLTMFEGAKLVYYKDNVAIEKAQAAYTVGTGKYIIAPMTTSDSKKQGLAIQFAGSEQAFINTAIIFNNVVLNTIMNNNDFAKPTTGVNRVYTVDGLGEGVTAGHDNDGVLIGGSYNGQNATLVVNCWDSNGIKTSFTIPFEAVVK